MKRCSNCNAENPDNAKYCHKCGQKLHKKRLMANMKNTRGEFLCGIGVLGMILVIIGSFGYGTLINIILGLCMMGFAIFMLDRRE